MKKFVDAKNQTKAPTIGIKGGEPKSKEEDKKDKVSESFESE